MICPICDGEVAESLEAHLKTSRRCSASFIREKSTEDDILIGQLRAEVEGKTRELESMSGEIVRLGGQNESFRMEVERLKDAEDRSRHAVGTSLKKLHDALLQVDALRKVVADALASARKTVNSFDHGDECPVDMELEEDDGPEAAGCECSTGEMYKIIDILMAVPTPSLCPADTCPLCYHLLSSEEHQKCERERSTETRVDAPEEKPFTAEELEILKAAGPFLSESEKLAIFKGKCGLSKPMGQGEPCFLKPNHPGPCQYPEKRNPEIGEGHAICGGCNQEIDPECCGCGDTKKDHGSPMLVGHNFIPMGCDCYRNKKA